MDSILRFANSARAAISCAPRVAAYRDIVRAAQSVSLGLRENFPEAWRAGTGPRVGVLATPSAEFVSAMLGIWLSGGIAVPLGASLPVPEKSYMVKDAGVTTLLATRKTLGCLRPLERDVSVGAHKCTLLLPDLFKKAHGSTHGPGGNHGRGGEEKPDVSYSFLGDDEESFLPTYFGGGAGEGSLLLYTSGTTGRPKGVLHTHGSILAQIRAMEACWEWRESDRILHCLPLHHIHGLVNALLTPLHAGGTVDFLPKFDASAVWGRIIECNSGNGPPQQAGEAGGEGVGASKAITVFTAVPTMYARLIEAFDRMGRDQQAVARESVASLRLMISGSAACPVPIIKRWEEISGHRLLERYGMTETGMVLSNPLLGERKVGHVGFPMPGVSVQLRAASKDDLNSSVLADSSAEPTLMDASKERPPGESVDVRSGELLVKGESLFDIYWGRPEETSAVFDEDGYFHTGDLVAVDEAGSYKMLGRMSVDIIKTGGFKVSALEVEGKLLEHDALAECAVVGIPDVTYGQVVAAIVASREGAACPDLAELQRWARERLEDCKVPRRLLVVDQVPRNGMGKVNKKQLLKLFEQKET